MRLNAPTFWYKHHGSLPQFLLSPIGRALGQIQSIRNRRVTPLQVSVPVICCGNLTVGGTGKTIVTLDIVRRLQARGHQPHILTRGYGGRLKGPTRVNPDQMTPELTGDEPFMMAQFAPVWVGADRRRTAQQAIDAGADCLVMDDGLQNPGLAKTRNYIIIDGDRGLGNRSLIPAGPLREDWRPGLDKAHAVILIGADRTGVKGLLPQCPLWRANLTPGSDLRRLQGQIVIAFAGIGRPSKFFDMLRSSGIHTLRNIPFPDHHKYSDADCRRLFSLSQEGRIQMVTTAKDDVKLPCWLKPHVLAIDVDLKWEVPSGIENDLIEAMDSSR